LDPGLKELPGRVYGDIAIRPFQVEADGIVFGLVPESHHEYPDGRRELDWAEFYPGQLGFSSPWDGCYDT
jgi:formate hydrogenlyase regulatory protein HycA